MAKARLEIFQYRHWHLAHTCAMPPGSPEKEQMMDMDIRALGNMVDGLMPDYADGGSSERFVEFLARMRNAIEHERWGKRMVFYHALWIMFAAPGKRDDPEQLRRNQSREILGEIDGVEDIVDPQLLGFYLDVMGGTLSFDTRRRLAARIAELAETPVLRLKYRVTEQLELLMIGEESEAKQGISQAILAFEGEVGEGVRADDHYGHYQYASSLVFLANLGGVPGRSSDDLFRLAATIFEKAMAVEGFSTEGKAMLHREIGGCHEGLKDLYVARRMYQESLALSLDPDTQIRLADVCQKMADYDNADNALAGLEWSSLTPPQQLDCGLVSGAISLGSGDRGRARHVIRQLGQLGDIPPYFERQRFRLVTLLADISSHVGELMASINEMKNELRRQTYIVEGIMRNTETTAESVLSRGVREHLEREAFTGNLNADRTLAQTRTQKVVKAVGRAALKKVIGELESDIVDGIRGGD